MPPRSRLAVLALFLALTLPFLSSRYPMLWIFMNNRPGRLPRISAFSHYGGKFLDVVRNCEDIVIDENRGVAILSCDPGRDKWNTVMGTFIDPNISGSLWYCDYNDFPKNGGSMHRLQMENFKPLKLTGFHPLGLGYWPETRTLYVANHAETGSTVEMLELDDEGLGVKYQRTLSHPLLNTPNSIAPISDHEIYVTNDHKWEIRHNPKMSILETYAAFPGGSVVYVNLETNTYKKVADVAFANGITMLNATHLAVASTTSPAVLIFEVEPHTKSLSITKKLSTPFLPDNLSIDSNGRLLIAGHPFPPALQKAAKTNHLYDLDGTGEGKPAAEKPGAPSWVAEWDGNAEGTIKDLYVGAGSFGTSSTAVRDVERGIGFVVGLYEKGIFVWNE